MPPVKPNHQTTYKQRNIRHDAWQYYNNHPSTGEHHQDAKVFIILAVIAVVALLMVLFTIISGM